MCSQVTSKIEINVSGLVLDPDALMWNRWLMSHSFFLIHKAVEGKKAGTSRRAPLGSSRGHGLNGKETPEGELGLLPIVKKDGGLLSLIILCVHVQRKTTFREKAFFGKKHKEKPHASQYTVSFLKFQSIVSSVSLAPQKTVAAAHKYCMKKVTQ